METDLIDKLKERYNESYKWVAIFTLITIIKQTLIENVMGINNMSLWKLLANILVIWALYTIVFLLPNKARINGLIITYFIISFVMLCDLVNYRYFQMPISVYAIYTAKYIRAISESIKVLVKVKDILIFIDVVLIWYILKKKKTIKLKPFKRERIVTLLAAVLLVFSAATINQLNFDNFDFTVDQLGVINYHFHELVNFFGDGIVNAYDWDDYLRDKNKQTSLSGRKFHGLAEGRNVFVIQVESLQNIAINRQIEGKEITPVLNKLIKNDTLYFDRYYQQVGMGNTSDAEFVSNNSLYASMKAFSYKEFEEKEFYTLPIALKQEGYNTIAFHGNDPYFWNRKNIYPAQGIDTFISEDELEQDEIIGMGISDRSVFRQSIDYYKNLQKPFYSLFITLTGHHPFIIPEGQRGLNIQGRAKDTRLGNYMEAVNYFDRALGEFIGDLKREGLYENSLIVIYGDHLGLDARDEEVKAQVVEFLGEDYKFEDRLNIPLIVHIPGSDVSETISTTGGHIDFFPTMLNLLGIESASNNLLGNDLLNTKEGFTAHQTYMIKGSFIDDEKVFEMSRDGKFENSNAWYIKTGEPVDLELCREGYEKAIREINKSNYILYNNLNSIGNEKVDNIELEP